MAKYDKQVKELLDFIGGKQNIQAVSHCMTRMRFVLTDPSKADEKRINEIDCVKGTFTQAGQYQVIIGNDVANFYNEFTKYAGIEGVSKDAVKQAAKTNQSLPQRIMGALGEIFAPIIPALICGGYFPVLGRAVQLFMAHWRSCVPFAACRYCLVHYKEDGDDPDPWYYPGPDPCFPTAP